MQHHIPRTVPPLHGYRGDSLCRDYQESVRMSLFACPKCQYPISRVTETLREDEDGKVLLRRRTCDFEECGHTWRTEERSVESGRCTIDTESGL